MKTILSMAMSVNGFIADDNGSEDFLSHENWLAFVKLANRIGNNVWGRKTYEAVSKWPKEYLEALKNVTKIIISRDENLQVAEGFTKVKSPQAAMSYLSKKGFKEILVTGGSSIYTAFLKKGLVDEIIFDMDPTLVGKGVIPFVFTGAPFNLELVEVNKLHKIVELHYRVLK